MNGSKFPLDDLMAAILAGLNEESQDQNLNFSNPNFQMPMETSFDEQGYSNVIMLQGERPEWVHDLDIIVFGRNNDEALVAENAEDEDWDAELAFRVMDRNNNERLKAMIYGEAATTDDKPETTFIAVGHKGENQVAVVAGKAHCMSCFAGGMSEQGMQPLLVMSLQETKALQRGLTEAINAVEQQ